MCSRLDDYTKPIIAPWEYILARLIKKLLDAERAPESVSKHFEFLVVGSSNSDLKERYINRLRTIFYCTLQHKNTLIALNRNCIIHFRSLARRDGIHCLDGYRCTGVFVDDELTLDDDALNILTLCIDKST